MTHDRTLHAHVDPRGARAVRRASRPRPTFLLLAAAACATTALAARADAQGGPVRGAYEQTAGGEWIPVGHGTILAGNDDGSSARVDLGFQLNFFGQTYDGLWVNNNGNVTFGSPMSTFTPFNLTGASNNPIIAPFFADVDTRAVRLSSPGAWADGTKPPAVGFTSYGYYSASSEFGQLFNPGGPNTGPGRDVFSVTWSDVGYYSGHTNLTNTFQLNLIRRDDTGVGLGNFDIEFNYNSIEWNTGDASGGAGGFGGTSAAAGYSAGTGQPGTFTQLAGSFVNGALVDGGSSALRDGAFFSNTPGRYLFTVRNGSAGQPGETPGTALLPTIINPGDPANGIAPAFIFRNATSGLWFDPPFTDAYIYQADDALTRFLGVNLPPLGDNLYDICWGAGFATCELGWVGGVRFDFPTLQSVFRVSGIDPLRDVQDPLAFPTQLFFENPTGNSFTMSPVLPTSSVPEPQTWMLLAGGLAGVLGIARRRRTL